MTTGPKNWSAWQSDSMCRLAQQTLGGSGRIDLVSRGIAIRGLVFIRHDAGIHSESPDYCPLQTDHLIRADSHRFFMILSYSSSVISPRANRCAAISRAEDTDPESS